MIEMYTLSNGVYVFDITIESPIATAMFYVAQTYYQ